MLQPKMGQHMEYAGNVTQRVMKKDNCYHDMHIWLVEKLYGYSFLHKANFSLLQRNTFYLTIMVVVKH